MQHDDWGVRADRWAGIRSEVLDVRGTAVHVLRHDAAPGAPADAPTQLLVHGLGGSSTNWLEVIAPLAEHGPVLAPDLPGFGRTEPPHRTAARTGNNARFLRALLRTVGLERVVLHGNSMGGLLAVLLADLEPDRIERLILVDPALPGPVRAASRIAPRTLARFAPFAVPPLGRAGLRYAWRNGTGESLWQETIDFVHGDPSRISPEIAALGVENLDWGRRQPWRLDGFVAAATSVVAAVTVGQRSLGQAVSRVEAPTLLLWGDADRLVGRPVIDHLRRRRPDWDAHVFETVGHVPQLEVPDAYLEVVTGWLANGDDAPDVGSLGQVADG
ncbi:alpha/beta fold hydrolase [Nitriliruptor alkaliphilus]|uniref:alpha/beta fold hydrolase n=1 Tax=Nitriliruptor alkaliphilus TaxID=427918 RepID=UPI000697F327|nr:alpha/beta hydrolase [Nitriliruptor alkaliphilus]